MNMMGSMRKYPPLPIRFWNMVDVRGPDDCWPWLGSKNAKGYGRIRRGRTNARVTHLSLELDGRPRPDQSLVAMHLCDNPPCCNPTHLRWGSVSENIKDAVAKGRWGRKGEASPMSKLTNQDVVAIRSSTMMGRDLARKYGVAASRISEIRNGKGWKHIA